MIQNNIKYKQNDATTSLVHQTVLYYRITKTSQCHSMQHQIQQEGWLPPTKRASAAKIN